MTRLQHFSERAIRAVSLVIKYRFYFIVLAYVGASYVYKFKKGLDKTEINREFEASFVDFKASDNSFVMLTGGNQIKLYLRDVIVPKLTDARRDCQSRLAHRAQKFIVDSVPTRNDLKVSIYTTKDGVYYGDVLLAGESLSNKLKNLSLAYPTFAPKGHGDEIDWCVLLQQYEQP